VSVSSENEVEYSKSEAGALILPAVGAEGNVQFSLLDLVSLMDVFPLIDVLLTGSSSRDWIHR
jgi:hypothetical protein